MLPLVQIPAPDLAKTSTRASPGKNRRRPSRSNLLSASGAALAVTASWLVMGAPVAGADTGNLIRNSQFSGGTGGWNAPDAGLVLTAGRGGGTAAHLSASGTRAVVLNDVPNTVERTTAGASYSVSAWVRTSTAPVTLNLRLREVAGAGLVKQTSTPLVLGDTSWQSISVTHTAQTDGATLDLNVFAPTLPQGSSFDVDDVTMVASTSAVAPPPPPPPPPATTGCRVDAKLVPSCGALFGAYSPIGSFGSRDWATATTNFENATTGRPFDIVKRYHDFSNAGASGAFPDASERALAAGGRIPFIAWVSKNYSTGADARWPDIAAGRYDASVIDPVAQRLKAYGGKVFLDLDHEMDGRTRTSDGTPEEYASAFRHMRSRFDAIGASNVVFVWTTTGYLGNEAKIRASYPGDTAVDWIAYDPYNFAACHNSDWRDFGTTVDTFYDWLMANGHGNKPFMLGEYGSVPDLGDPQRRASWFRGQVAAMKAHPNIKAVQYYNSQGSCPANLSQSLVGDGPALAAFGTSGNDPYFRVAH